jgi:hypothetical protein
VPAESKPVAPSSDVRAHHDSGSLSDSAEVATLTWRSAKCATQSCVEVADMPDGGVAIRDSKAGDTSPVLLFSADEWSAFVTGVKAGEFD